MISTFYPESTLHKDASFFAANVFEMVNASRRWRQYSYLLLKNIYVILCSKLPVVPRSSQIRRCLLSVPQFLSLSI